MAAVIDMHAHWYPPRCVEQVIKNQLAFVIRPGRDGGLQLLWRGSHVMSVPRGQDDLAMRLAVMDESDVAIQVLSIGALDICWAGKTDDSISQRINDALAEVCQRSSGRFRFAATLPFYNDAGLIRELDRVLALGAIGIGLTTTVGGSYLDAPALRSFWREANKRKLLVFIHPTFPSSGPSNDQGEFLTTGYLGETALAATKLVFAGVLEECPDVRIVWSHLGGSLAMLVDRLDRSYKRYESCPQPPSSYLRRCFYDTASAHGPAFDCARATFGIQSLVFGTDEPHVRNASKEVLSTLKSRPWPETELERVLNGNARILGLR